MDRRRGIFNAQREGFEYNSNYLTIIALEDGMSVKFSNACYYSTDSKN